MIEIITRTVARKLGLRRYFTGKPCRRGHVAERYVAGKECVICKRNRSETSSAADIAGVNGRGKSTA